MLFQGGKQKTWWYRFRLGGQIVHESSKSTSKTVAREAERQRRRELERNYNKIEKRTLPPRFEQGATAWLEGEKPHLAERTQDIYSVALRCHLIPVMGSWLLCDIGGDEIKAYQAKRKAAGASARTLNKELQVLRQVLKRHKLWANLEGEVKFERESENVGKALTPEEEARLLKACESNQLLDTAVTVALNTTLRKNEIRLLRWGQIDFFKRTLTVGKSKTEGGSGTRDSVEPSRLCGADQVGGPLPGVQGRRFRFPGLRSGWYRAGAPDERENRRLTAYQVVAHRVAGCVEAGRLTNSVPRPSAYLRNQTRGGSSQRANHHGDCGSPQPPNARTLFAHPHGSEASRVRRYRGHHQRTASFEAGVHQNCNQVDGR